MHYFLLVVKSLVWPIVPCASKSGGIHGNVHFDKAYPAKDARNALVKVAEALGYKGTEVFPKKVKHNKGNSVGGFINLPYQNAENTTRYCLKNGKKISFEEYLDHAESKRTSLDRDMGIQRKSWSTALGMMLNKLFPEIRTVKYEDGLYYSFPSLKRCRERFEEAMNDTLDWPETLTNDDIDNTGDQVDID